MVGQYAAKPADSGPTRNGRMPGTARGGSGLPMHSVSAGVAVAASLGTCASGVPASDGPPPAPAAAGVPAFDGGVPAPAVAALPALDEAGCPAPDVPLPAAATVP